jgi:alkanesulfonate monooxygenase SsuD/methylene tetrahydromethanopterin reductase-like flavin-dependent oxidoreductase (luciferase family)
MAGLTPGAVRRAGRHGDGWIGSPKASLPVLEQRAALFRSEAATAGRPGAELTVIREIYVGTDHDAARREPRAALEAMYGGYTAWDKDNRVTADDPLAVPYEALIRERFVIGDADECVEQLLPYRRRLGATLLMLRFQWPGLDARLVTDSMARFASKVKPLVEARA